MKVDDRLLRRLLELKAKYPYLNNEILAQRLGITARTIRLYLNDPKFQTRRIECTPVL